MSHTVEEKALTAALLGCLPLFFVPALLEAANAAAFLACALLAEVLAGARLTRLTVRLTFAADAERFFAGFAGFAFTSSSSSESSSEEKGVGVGFVEGW